MTTTVATALPAAAGARLTCAVLTQVSRIKAPPLAIVLLDLVGKATAFSQMLHAVGLALFSGSLALCAILFYLSLSNPRRREGAFMALWGVIIGAVLLFGEATIKEFAQEIATK